MFERKVSIFVVFLIITLIGSPVQAVEITISWNPPTENCDGTSLVDLAGSTVWWGTSPRPVDPPPSCSVFVDQTLYPNSFIVGPTDTQAVVSVFDAEVERTFYIAVTAWDNSGNQSQYSGELVWFVPPTMVAPAAPTNLRVVAE